jgi:ATP-dependent DNA helicase DinG
MLAEPSLRLGLRSSALRRIFAPDGLLARATSRQRDAIGKTAPSNARWRRLWRTPLKSNTIFWSKPAPAPAKSYAYLVPLILWAIANNKKVVVATHTKALQQQLVERDLPFLRDLFLRRMGTEFRFALCLGHGNYVCPRRLAKAEVGGLFATRDEVDELKEINSFARQSKTGRNIDLPFEPSAQLWAQVNRESDLCMGRACPCMKNRSSTWRGASRKKRTFWFPTITCCLRTWRQAATMPVRFYPPSMPLLSTKRIKRKKSPAPIWVWKW